MTIVDLRSMNADDLTRLYARYGSVDAAAIAIGVNRKTFVKYWNDYGLPNFTTILKDEYDPELHTIAVCGDIHIGSKQQQVTYFLDFINMCKEQDIKTLLIVGDIIEGIMPREGAVHDRFLHSIDKIIEYTDDIFSNFADDFNNIRIIMGNHDESLNARKDGFNICRHIAEQYSSVEYEEHVDEISQPVPIEGGLRAILWHGTGGCNKNLVTRTRNKTIDFINATEEWDFLFAGHCHMFSKDFWCQKYGISSRCFQSTTRFLAQKGKTPDIGGSIITYTINKKGKPINVVEIPVEYKTPILHDY